MSYAVPNYAGKWNELEPKLSKFLLKEIDTMGFEEMTPVQKATIPLFLKNKDVVVEAVTGSGKTLAFVLPVIEKLLKLDPPLSGRKVGAIIISPTRELAQQIYQVFLKFLRPEGAGKNLKPLLATGGGGSASLDQEISGIKCDPPRIIIGTPGRLEELLITRKGLVDLKDLEILVMDEADRLLDMGFTLTINALLAILPKQRRTGLFSATMTDDLSELVRVGLRNPVKVVVKVSKTNNLTTPLKEQRIPDSLQVEYIVCRPWQKLNQIIKYISSHPTGKYVVYFAACACVDYFSKIFTMIPELEMIDIISLHGKMDTKRRTSTYQKFSQLGIVGRGAMLITTDVASRGLDIPDIDGVIHFDLPSDPKAFAHRCGRAARAGRKGKALYFLSPGHEEKYPEFLQIRKVPSNSRPYIGKELSLKEGDCVNKDEDLEAMNILKDLRSKVASDRDLVEKGVKAFVSFVRTYSKHQASYIFRLNELDFAGHAWSYLLLRLPKMPELKNKKLEFEDFHVMLNDIPYVDKAREAQRQSKLKAMPAKASTAEIRAIKLKRERNKAWSEKTTAKAKKIKRKQSKMISNSMAVNSGLSKVEVPSKL